MPDFPMGFYAILGANARVILEFGACVGIIDVEITSFRGVAPVIVVGERDGKKIGFSGAELKERFALFPRRPSLAKVDQDIALLSNVFGHAAPTVRDDLSGLVVRAVEVD